MNILQQTDVLIIGAGPSGSSAAALLRKKGYQVIIIEKQHFPRFSIGESLLPQCMVFLEEAGLLETVKEHVEEYAFQFKNGAAFLRGQERSYYDFTQKFSEGPGTTWQIRRANFDHLLAQKAEKDGAELRFGHEVIAVDVEADHPILTIKDQYDHIYQVQAKFLLDASGFGRILPKLLDIESPSNFPVRRAVFGHIEDGIGDDPEFDRNKILISVHEKDHRAWYWLIPFADGRSSFGVVAEQDFFDHYGYENNNPEQLLDLFKRVLLDEPSLSHVLRNMHFDTPIRTLVGYSANVKTLANRNFALLGNAGEFLDPVFSSGVTIALKSSSLAIPLVDKVLRGERVDWMSEYEKPLRKGICVFRAYVEAWYDGEFQDIVFSKNQNEKIRQMIASLLAGYAWDESNPIYRNARQRLNTLADYCRNNMEQSKILEKE
ncbi:NAD(P)/FAD-dependent oxidoreductase [Acinetobacter bereziniae]|uniref:NAD(P)/FAD-dependent oxidoreductase n=1 Tax=Acinetobacter bereziniae TaxID=106648 RepID=UPI001580C871|nr:NAD(P)/FAD-dependent oxidoreductase [Acinetobacter bereziniae]NUF62348.1 NAD(P)/FAD-dependent oxidoreductase [Acinetobacter bereziniae]NUG06058.1 NAD(P)/FAD-dependent oxidoreductase [Acinetobacter bereziniae]NUG63489.1 NAD(P)/FAD-dependent oxidoreductase [Acinetobacter bereziniae]NUG68589.1 NAD(P)/FAD-dependent oxidoreductase [Acinetobacter bereziniae]NUG78456.1 NAD(P)/FAD-dependent oxidoreductase [Acinetobacter bereziniae]